MKSCTKPAIIPVDEKLPAINESVWVICKDFRCVGFLDRQKVWRDHNGITKLEDVVGWLPLGR